MTMAMVMVMVMSMALHSVQRYNLDVNYGGGARFACLIDSMCDGVPFEASGEPLRYLYKGHSRGISHLREPMIDNHS